MTDHPQFDDFKRRALANPEVRAAYVAALVRDRREIDKRPNDKAPH